MDNITHTVKEKMQKTYSFTGTQLLVTGLGVVILLSIFACAGRHGGPRGMMNRDMMRGDRGQMMQQYDRQGKNRQSMMRGQQSSDQGINNQRQPEPMMNGNQNNQPTANQSQPTTPSAPAGTGN